MPQYDLPADRLSGYRTATPTPADLGSFWRSTLDRAREASWAPTAAPVDTGLRAVDTFDVTFPGFAGEPVRAWLHRPAGVRDDLPAVVWFVGYGGGRGLPHQTTPWPLAGYATLVVDNRGQGAGGGHVGDTPDDHDGGLGSTGFATRGIDDRETYYYRRLFTDGVRAVDAVRRLPGVDPTRVITAGVSQGGGIALAASGLCEGLAGVLADVPFLCDFPRGTAVAAEGPYTEIARHLATRRLDVDRVFATLAYFDAAVLVSQSPTPAPALFSVALMDQVCPPSTVYAAYNAYPGTKELVTYPFNDHEGGQFHQEARQLDWLRRTVPPA